MKLKKILASILCLAMVLGTMSFTVFAGEAQTVNSYTATTEGESALVITEDTTIVIDGDVELVGAKGGAGIYVAEGATLTITGNGTLTAIGNAGVDEGNGAAGIGGTATNGDCGNIVIDGVTVVAKGYGRHGAGIGSGNNGISGNITIQNGANVTAQGGYYVEGGPITSYWGKKEAEGGAGIGGGSSCTQEIIGDILIDNSTVIAYGGQKAAGIGCGYWSGCGKIDIVNGSNVTAAGGASSAGIGTSRTENESNRHEKHNTADITISESTVTAIGGECGAGIGTGYDSKKAGYGTTFIKITNSTVNATGGDGGAGIGGGVTNNNVNIDVDNSKITAVAGEPINVDVVFESWYRPDAFGLVGEAIGGGATECKTEGIGEKYVSVTESFINGNYQFDNEITIIGSFNSGIMSSKITDENDPEKYRERFGIELNRIVAQNSVQVKILTENDELLATVSRREFDRDDEAIKLFPMNGGTTVNVVVAGRLAGSWDTDWVKTPNVSELPATLELWVDGVHMDTIAAFSNEDNKADYIALPGVEATAMIGETKYGTLQEAIDAAEEGDTITLLAGEYNGFNVPKELNNVTFVGETDADGNNLVTIKTLEDGITSHNGGIFVGSKTTTFKNLNFTAGTTPGASSSWMSSSLGNTNGDTGMSSSLKNLTVENCNFTGSGAYQAIWTNQGNVTVRNSTITNYDTAVDTYGIHADQQMVIENTEIADVRNAFHTGEAEVGSQIDVTETTIDSDVIDIGGAAAVTITNSEISNAVVTTYTENNQMTISGTLLINSVINEEAKGTYNGVNIAEDYDGAIAAVAANNEIISTKLNISFEQVEAGLYNIVLNGEDDIYEFVGAELTFKNESTTFGNEYMNYEILGIGGKTNAEKSIEKADTYALRLVDGAERMCGRDLVIGQVKFFGQGDINFTVSEGTVVTTEYGTNLGQYYTLDANTLTVDAITNGAVEEVTRDVVVNVAYKHALDGTYWNDNQITVTLKDGFGNSYGPFDVSDKIETIPNVKLGRLTVTLEAPGFRKYVYNTTLEAGADENDALVLNFWNDIKRDTVQSPLAEIEAGKGFTNKNFLVGDIVMDYTVDEYDLAAVTSYYGMYELTDADKYIKYDLNRDGNIDIIDVHYVLHTLNN